MSNTVLKPDGLYFEYLRKSREDLTDESRGMEETLARHEKQLTALAAQLGIRISRVYKEVVSGETIAARPEMLRMLNDIEEERPDGVLVTEISRLARGDTRDQGLLMETFKCSNTLIITPMKIFNPNNEFDEEYAEFNLFMSRREYTAIKRRLMAGRTAAAAEGKYAGSREPYGYEKYKLKGERGYSLKPVPDQAEIVKLIFDMYIFGTPDTGNRPASACTIANVLNDMHIPAARGDHWTHGVIRTIVTNCVYAGYIRWGRRRIVKTIQDGKTVKSYPVQKDYQIAKGIHAPIISEETWEQAQSAFLSRSRRPAFLDTPPKNPFASVLRCGCCGRAMIRRPPGKNDRTAWIICATHGCPTCGSAFDKVEYKISTALSEWFSNYKIQTSNRSPSCAVNIDSLNASLTHRLSQISDLKAQLDKTYTLLEKEVYTVDIFKDRSSVINKKIREENLAVLEIRRQIEKYEEYDRNRKQIIPKWEYLIRNYWELQTEDRNRLLKELVEKIVYIKSGRGTKRSIPDFELKIYPRI